MIDPTLAIVDRAGITQTGHVRRLNEDAFLLREPLFMVADGVGGAQAGEVASRMAAEAFAEVDLAHSAGEAALRDAIVRANAAIHERASRDERATGMGTTVAAALFAPDATVTLANVGDSRAYLLREGRLQRLSEDHSLVGELVRRGELSEAEAERHPQRSVITRALGSGPSVDVDVQTVTARDGDLFLLCTDGLNTMVGEDQIAAVLGSGAPAERIARELVRAALAGGGEDNVTVIVFRIGEPDAPDPVSQEQTARILLDDPRLTEPEETDGGRRSYLRPVLTGLALLLVAAGLAVGAVVGLRASHFIGADQGSGRVDIYQGVPVVLPFGIRLYHAVYQSSVPYSALDPVQRRRLFDHTLRSETDARRIVRRLEAANR
jgi:PPM family protein phosphatase